MVGFDRYFVKKFGQLSANTTITFQTTVLVLNEMVLVLVLENRSSTSTADG